MALPILNNASLHELTVPSTGKKYNYRPYLVKEEKILLQAKESKDDKLMMRSLTKLIESCVEDINTNELTNIKMTNDIKDNNTIIKLTPDIDIELSYIKYNKMVNDTNYKKKTENTIEVFKTIKNSIVSVNTQDERMIFADESTKDQDTFLDSLSSAQFQEITEFITEGPAVVYKDDITCTTCKEVFKIELRGMSSFF